MFQVSFGTGLSPVLGVNIVWDPLFWMDGPRTHRSDEPVSKSSLNTWPLMLTGQRYSWSAPSPDELAGLVTTLPSPLFTMAVGSSHVSL